MDESAVTSAGLPFVGVELGGTKCVCTLAYGPDAILQQRVIPTTLPETTLPAIVATLREWDAAYGFAAMGIASFGPICLDPVDARYGSILATNKSGWRDCDIVSAIAGPFERPFTFDTDVNGAALAEMRWGCAQGLQDFAYVTVGTGIGVGLIVHGLPTRGIGHSEIGHIRVPRTSGDTVASSCRYHDDCVEGLASGSALVARLAGRDVNALTPDDPVWKPMISALAAMAHTLVATTGPFRIAIGGGVVTRQPHLLAQIETEMEISLAGYMALPPRRPIIVAPALGELAGPLGSIALAMAASAQ